MRDIIRVLDRVFCSGEDLRRVGLCPTALNPKNGAGRGHSGVFRGSRGMTG